MTREDIKTINDIVHKTIYGFFDICGDEETPMTDKDKLLLEVNKAVCNNIKDLEQEPCEDAISRREAIRMFKYNYKGERIPDYDCDNFPVRIDLKTVKEMLRELPSVTPKQRTGHWIERAEDYYKAINAYGGGVDENTEYFVDDIACPKCLSKFSTIDNETERFNYCPNCGAKMEEQA